MRPANGAQQPCWTQRSALLCCEQNSSETLDHGQRIAGRRPERRIVEDAPGWNATALQGSQPGSERLDKLVLIR